jgi:osmotically-inducible protein OsmY
MSNNDWRRNDQERYRDQDNDRRRSHQGQSYGRGTDDQGDGTIAQRGFGNAQSGYDRGGDDRDRGYSRLGGGDYDRGGFGRGSRESMDNRSYRGDDRSQSGTFSGNDYSSGFYGADQGRGTSRNPDRDAAYRELNDPSHGYVGRDRNYGFSGGEGRGFWDRATDEVSSWFGDEAAERRRRQDEQRGGDWGGQSHRGRGPKGYTRSDNRIQEDVCERLSHDHHVDASEIEVSVSAREVTLSGTVDSREAKRWAEDIAESVSGVAHVQNNLRVQQQSGSMGPIGAAASTTTGVSMEAGMPTGAASSNLGRTSGGGMSSSAVAGAMGTSGAGQSATGVEVSRSEGSTVRRKGGTAS